MSTIVWILAIGLYGGYNSMSVRIEFPTEQACEAARSRTATNGAGRVETMCYPQKKEQAK